MWQSILPLVVSVIICTKYVDSKATSLRMSFKENEEAGSLVANLYQLFNVESSLIHARTFKILSQRLRVGSRVVKEYGEWVSLNEENGHLEVDSPIDRETECGDDPTLECVISVEVVMLPNANFRILHFEFLVSDDNDHTPVFPELRYGDKFAVNVGEDLPIGSSISLDHIMATDADLGKNAEIYYSLSQNDFFGIKQFDDVIGTPHLDLVVIKEPDFEIKRAFDLILTARDSGEPPRSSRIPLEINIIDANDHAPVFEKKVDNNTLSLVKISIFLFQEYKLKLKENLPADTLIDTLIARDADHAELGRIEYFIPKKGNTKEARNLLVIQPENGEIRLKKELDREKHNGIRVVVGARDAANQSQGGPRVGKTVVVITVEDINDNDPIIHVNIVFKGPNKHKAYVPEGTNRGTFIAHITASDADLDENGQVDLSMRCLPAPTAFELEDNLVKISTLLDREHINEYTLELEACDRGKRPRCSKKNVTIVVVDINDNTPQFTAAQPSFVIPENREVGTVLTMVKAFDKDSLNQPALVNIKKDMFMPSSNGVIRYGMSGGKSVFDINPTSGKITLIGSLDYETNSFFKLIISARDLGSPRRSNTTVITVTVLDVNDHRPEFSNPAIDNSSIVATILDPGPIAKIKALDRDVGRNALLKYSIVKETDLDVTSPVFIIDKTSGELRFNSSNNLRELIGDHKILIKATDSGSPPLSTTTAIYIRVTDLALSEIHSNYGIGEGGLDSSVILLASLAAATVVLLVILAFIIVKCKRENKEVRTYNCRDAETKKGWLSKINTPPRRGSLDEVVVVTSPDGVTSTQDANFMRSMEIGRKNTLRSNVSNSHSAVMKDLISSDNNGGQSGPLPRTRNYDDYKKDMQTRTQTDGDSGKGESDRDSVSGERIDKSALTPQYNSRPMQYSNSLGNRCNENCRLYGHSDACWMDVSATTLNERPSRVQSPRNVDLGYMLHATNHNEYQQDPNFDNCNLETIGETQPLRYVLDSPTAHYPPPHEYPIYPQYNNQTYEDYNYPAQPFQDRRSRCYEDQHFTIPRANSPMHDGYFSPSRASVRNTPSPSTSSSTLRPTHSFVTSPVDVYNRPASRNSRSDIENATVSDKIKMFSKSSNSGVQRKPSAASLRDNLLQKRLIMNNTSFSSTADDSSPTSPNEYSGETSMQETEEILSNINQLIST